MKAIAKTFLILCAILGCVSVAVADQEAPWGTAKHVNPDYAPKKVLYDLYSGNKDDLSNILDRVGYLFKLYGSDTFDSSIVVIIHGDAIPFFAVNELDKYRDLMNRAQSLTVGTSIEFRMCGAAAKVLNYEAKDIHGFVQMVPMADAEIIRLQHDNYAYVQ